MHVGILTIELLLHETRSLKQKRYIISRLKDRIRKKFNVSVIEAGYQDKWQRSLMGVACISNNTRIINSAFDRILDMTEKSKDGFEILDSNIEIL